MTSTTSPLDRKKVNKVQNAYIDAQGFPANMYFDAHGFPVNEDDHWTDEEGEMWADQQPPLAAATPYGFLRVHHIGHEFLTRTGETVKWHQLFTDEEGKHWTPDEQSRAAAAANSAGTTRPASSSQEAPRDYHDAFERVRICPLYRTVKGCPRGEACPCAHLSAEGELEFKRARKRGGRLRF